MKKKKDEEYTYESVDKLVGQWTAEHLPDTFTFREHQRESVTGRLLDILTGVKTNVIEAPTGSGKSIIAIITAGVMWDCFEQQSYILVTDMGLFDQYVSDFKKYKLPWGWLRGRGQYSCSLCGLPFIMSECQTSRVGYKVLMNKKMAATKGYYCSYSCDAIQDRVRAVEAPVTLMTYQLYIYEMNMVLPNVDDPQFLMRDLIICDECHKIPDIVQNICSPVIDLDAQVNDMNLINESGIDKTVSVDKTVDECKSIYNGVSLDDSFEHIKALSGLLDDFAKTSEAISQYVKTNNIDLKKKQNHRIAKALGASQRLSTVTEMCKYYIKAIEAIGTQYIVINGDNWKHYTINCVFESYLVNCFFNAQSKSELMMSATIGDAQMFENCIGASQYKDKSLYKFTRIPSTFDFSKSPIYILPDFKMSYREKDANFAPQMQVIEAICNHHKGQRGIIHTGSYEFKNHLTETASAELSDRLYTYSSAKDKGMALDSFTDSKNGILAGPTLIEGINLPDDECRFMIIMKVPYVSLQDKLVCAKKDCIPGWYESYTLKNVIQSIGRGVRSKTDWCITYIIDGSFVRLYEGHRFNMADDFQKRVSYISLR